MRARQVGKSTLLHQIFDSRQDVLWMNGDESDIRELFSEISSTRMRTILGNHKILIIDEAQRIPDIGLRIKLITDQIPNVQVVTPKSRLSAQNVHNKEIKM